MSGPNHLRHGIYLNAQVGRKNSKREEEEEGGGRNRERVDAETRSIVKIFEVSLSGLGPIRPGCSRSGCTWSSK